MKRSSAEFILSMKLQKQEALFKGYANGSINLKCLCDNLSSRALTSVVDDIKMLPPTTNYDHRLESYFDMNEWESEDNEE